MNFKKYNNIIDGFKGKYAICLYDKNGLYFSKHSIYKYLGLSFNDYDQIIKKHNRLENYDMVYFLKIEDYNNCIEELEPYLIMAELIR